MLVLALSIAMLSVAVLSCAAPPGASSGPHQDGLVRSDWHVPSESGVLIAVREVRSPARSDGRPVLLVHGARVPGVASFDLPVAGGSLAGDLARQGHRVFVMDARGYGASTRPPQMSAPPSEHPPLATGDHIVRDIHAVANRMDAGRVALVGWATGGHWAAWYASQHPEKVSHLVVYNSLYGGTDGHPTLSRGSEYENPGRPGEFDDARIGAYRLSTAAALLPSWDAGIPSQDKAEWRDPRVLAAYQEAALASDPTSAGRTPASFRAPTGALKDSFTLATGRQLWPADRITAKTLVLRSEYDFWSRAQDVPTLVADLTRARAVRAVRLDRATHYAHLDRAERGRDQLITELTGWLAT